jgi:hypothetical protein
MPICNHCGEFKDEDQFYWRWKKLGIRQPTCKECKAKFDKRYYKGRTEEHKKTVKVQRAARREEARDYILNYLSSHPCVDCGETDIRVLEFDHVRGRKKMAISQMVGVGYSIKAIEKEIRKCEIRCGHCHKIKHNEDRGWFRG